VLPGYEGALESKEPITVAEMASMGGRARAAKYTREQLREFAKDAGRPVKLDGRARRRLRQLLAAGRSQAECAAELGVSPRTVGRAVARVRAGV
jgi:DNA-binding NarL/FixJ family response regulator